MCNHNEDNKTMSISCNVEYQVLQINFQYYYNKDILELFYQRYTYHWAYLIPEWILDYVLLSHIQ